MDAFLKQILGAVKVAEDAAKNIANSHSGNTSKNPPQSQGSLAPDFTNGQSAQLAPQVAMQQEKTSNDTATPIVNSQGGHAVQQATRVGSAAAKDAGKYATDVGTAFGYPLLAAQQGGKLTPEQEQKVSDATTNVMAPGGIADPMNSVYADTLNTGLKLAPGQIKSGAADSLSAARTQPGGLQAGFINPREIAGLPSKPGAIVDGNGNPVSSQVEPQTGGKFVNETPANLKGGTPAQVRARASTGPNIRYVPGEKPDTSVQEPTPINSSGEQNVNAGSETQAPPSPRTDYTRTHDVSDPNIHPDAIDPTENIKRNLTVDGRDIKNLKEKAQVDATLNGYGIKGGQAQQAQVADETINTLAQRAKADILARGGTISRGNMINEVAKGLFKIAGQHDINPDEIAKTAEDYVDNAYARTQGVKPDGTFASRAPDDIPGSAVQDMKKYSRGDASSTFGKDPATWTKSQKVARPASDAIDALLDEQYPTASKLNNDMSDLYKARDSLRKGANTEGSAAQKAAFEEEAKANAPKGPGFLKRHAKEAVLTGIPLLLGGGYGLSKIPWGDLAGAAANKTNGNSGTMKGFKLNTSPPAQMNSDQTKKQTGLTYTADDYQRDIKSPQYVPGSNFKNTIDSQWANTLQQANNKLTPGAKTFMGGDAQTALNNQGQLNNVNLEGLTSVWQRLKSVQDYSSYTNNPSNPYVKEMGVLQQANDSYAQAYHDITGKDPDEKKQIINPGDTPEQVKSKLQLQNNFLMQSYQQYQPYWNISNVTPDTQQNQGVYQQNTGLPTSVNGALPPIPSGFKMTSTL